MIIPKVIHYCWFGGKKKPKLVQDCIASWKLILSDFEIIEWNEKNSNLNNHFVQKAYSLKKWAFVSDYIRLKALYDYGGIYLDTDMLVLKNLDVLLNNKCFFGAEDDKFISCGIIGAEKNNVFIKECLFHYDNINLNNEISWGQNTIPRIITNIYRKKYDYLMDFNREIEQNELVIYPSNYFYSLPYKYKHDARNYSNYLSPNSFAVHLWNESWVVYNEFQYLRSGQYSLGLKLIFKNVFINGKIEITYFRKILSSFKESLIKK